MKNVFVFLICVILLASFSGCSATVYRATTYPRSFSEFEKGIGGGFPVYGGACTGVAVAHDSFSEKRCGDDIFGDSPVFGTLCLIDLPLTILVDTVLIPVDLTLYTIGLIDKAN